MVRNKELYAQALAFRRRGFTYVEIAKICGVSKATVSNWCRSEQFSKAVAKDNAARAARENTKRLSLLNKARNAERKNRYAEAERGAETEFTHYRKDTLFVAGLTLYIALGDRKSPLQLRISSGRHELHTLFIRFAMAYLGVEKTAVRFWLSLYPTHDEVKAMKHWSKKMGISVAQFYKTQVIKGSSSKETLQFGVGNTIIGSTVLKRKLNRWIERALKEF
jgi:predicted transcriptional regulator